MPKLLLFKHGGALFPIDDEAERDRFRAIGQGELVIVDHKKNRNPANHRRFFEFRNQTFDMQDWFTDKERWRQHLLMLGGHVEDWFDIDGAYYFRVKSIAWEELDEIEFREVFKRCVDGFIGWYQKHYGYRWDDEAMMRILGFIQ